MTTTTLTIDQISTYHLPSVRPNQDAAREPRQKEKEPITDPALLRVDLQTRIPWTRYPWQVGKKEIAHYSLYELVFAAIEHCCKRHHGEVPHMIHVPLSFLPQGGMGTIYFHQIEVRVCANEKLPGDLVLCVR